MEDIETFRATLRHRHDDLQKGLAALPMDQWEPLLAEQRRVLDQLHRTHCSSLGWSFFRVKRLATWVWHRLRRSSELKEVRSRRRRMANLAMLAVTKKLHSAMPDRLVLTPDNISEWLDETVTVHPDYDPVHSYRDLYRSVRPFSIVAGTEGRFWFEADNPRTITVHVSRRYGN